MKNKEFVSKDELLAHLDELKASLYKVEADYIRLKNKISATKSLIKLLGPSGKAPKDQVTDTGI